MTVYHRLLPLRQCGWFVARFVIDKGLAALFRVASYRQIIVGYWLILARSGSFRNRISSVQGEPFGLGNLRSLR